MRRKAEVMQLVDGKLFDDDWYERTDLLPPAFAAASGYCVVVWTAVDDPSGEHIPPTLVGPFESADLATRTADGLR